MVDFFGFNIILDDIVFPDGQTRMGVLGGGGPQAAFGMRLWAESVGLAASVGPDLPTEAIQWFEEAGIHLGALRYSEYPTPRAWQAMETDGRRTQVWRVPPEAIQDHLTHEISRIPAELRVAHGYHMGIHPLDTEFEFLADLKATGALLSIEPYKPAERLPTRLELEQLLTVADIFSPNLVEAQSLLGHHKPLDLLGGLLAAGTPMVVLRMGDHGSLVATHSSKTAIQVPAVPVTVVDPVGAGNAFCGGFLAGWVQTHDLTRSAAMGAVSASFLVEQVGLPRLTENTRRTAAERLAFVFGQSQVISIPQGGFSL